MFFGGRMFRVDMRWSQQRRLSLGKEVSRFWEGPNQPIFLRLHLLLAKLLQLLPRPIVPKCLFPKPWMVL